MTRMVSILRAAHCRSTHHYFAIDALSQIETVSGRRLANLLLKYHQEYLSGAKAPDTKFRDFKNHVLHVADGNWGGAPQACEKWLAQAIACLDAGKWKKAAYACGVLSHYFTDPLMPLHTGQAEREAIVHRPLEWSVCKSYNEIHAQLDKKQYEVNFKLSTGTNWISGAVLAGASVAHQHYHRLIEIYDLTQGCRNPPAGLNHEARERIGELFGIALAGWSQILTRIADETTSDLPETSLTLPALLATIDMPWAWVVRKIGDSKEKRVVRAILQEYEQTGTVRKNLPAEVKSVREQRAADTTRESMVTAAAGNHDADSAQTGTEATLDIQEGQDVTSADAETQDIQSFDLLASPLESADARDELDLTSAPLRTKTREAESGVGPTSNLVDAPSIGPKTAKRFAKIGIHTIGGFLEADTATMVAQLDTRWINENLLRDWKDQARLVCEVPILCGYKAQLLVAADCRSSQQLAATDASVLFHKICSVCDSNEGQRILRSSQAPSLSDIREWTAATPRLLGEVRRAS